VFYNLESFKNGIRSTKKQLHRKRQAEKEEGTKVTKKSERRIRYGTVVNCDELAFGI